MSVLRLAIVNDLVIQTIRARLSGPRSAEVYARANYLRNAKSSNRKSDVTV